MIGELRIEYMDLDELLAARVEDNPKDHDIDGIALSISRRKFNAPPTINETSGKLLAGHGRLEALDVIRTGLKAGTKDPEGHEWKMPGHIVIDDGGRWRVPVVRGVAFESDVEAYEYLVSDNALTIARGWNDDKVAPILKRLAEAKVPLVQLGWSKRVLDGIFQRLRRRRGKDEGPDVDNAGKLQQQWKTERGQVWFIEGDGQHRLMCGDSTDAADVARLCITPADFLFSSPPYNVDVHYRDHDDREMPVEEYIGWLRELCRLWVAQLRFGRAFAWNTGVSARTYPHRHVLMLEDCGLTFVRQYIWEKAGVPVPTWFNTERKRLVRHLTSNFKHEMVYVMSRGVLEVGGETDFDATLEHDVFRIHQSAATRDLPAGDTKSGAGNINLDRRAKKVHPAAFPTKLPGAFIDHFTARGEVVLEPFSGSGSTIVAAEERARACYAMEKDPAYVAVALDRLQRMGLTVRQA